MIKSICLQNFLSFGSSSAATPLGSLNVLIGPNGSGKSNLLEAIELMRGAPRDLATSIRDGGGIRDWLWKGATLPTTASVEAVLANPKGAQDLRYHLAFTEVAQQFQIVDERIEFAMPQPGKAQPYFHYRFEHGHGVLNVNGSQRRLQREDIDVTQSILSQRRDPDQYPEVTYLGNVFAATRLYREWSFGRYTAPRMPQKADLPNDMLASDCSNLGLVLNRLQRDAAVKSRLLRALRDLYQGIDDYGVQVEGGTVQLFFHEGSRTIPATRLSDGTLRYLASSLFFAIPILPLLSASRSPSWGFIRTFCRALASSFSRRPSVVRLLSQRTQMCWSTPCPTVLMLS